MRFIACNILRRIWGKIIFHVTNSKWIWYFVAHCIAFSRQIATITFLRFLCMLVQLYSLVLSELPDPVDHRILWIHITYGISIWHIIGTMDRVSLSVFKIQLYAGIRDEKKIKTCRCPYLNKPFDIYTITAIFCFDCTFRKRKLIFGEH